MLIWSPCGNSHLCDCLRWWWTRWKRKPSDNGHRRHRRKTANVRNRRIFWVEPLPRMLVITMFFSFLLGESLQTFAIIGKGGNPKNFDFGCLYFLTFPFSVLVGLGIYTTDQDCALGGFDLSVEYQI